MWVMEFICYSVIVDLVQFGPNYRTNSGQLSDLITGPFHFPVLIPPFDASPLLFLLHQRITCNNIIRVHI